MKKLSTALLSLGIGLLAGLSASLANPPNMIGLPACTLYGQGMSIDLSTTFPANWQVTGPGAAGPSSSTLNSWSALPNNWIQPKAFSTAWQFPYPGDFTYIIRFYIPCDPKNYSFLSLAGSIAADNSFKAYVNGVTTPFASCAGPNCFAAPANPTAFGNIASMLVRGVNTIQIVVHNIDTYSGLAVSAKLTARCGRECCLVLQNPDILQGGNPTQ